MKRHLLFLLLVISYQGSYAQIYFDELYGADVNSGEGIGTNGTIAIEGGYLNWSYVYGKEQPLLFTVDLQGGLIDSVSIYRPDTAALWGINVLQVNDTLFLGVVWRQVYSEPQDQKGDIGLIFFGIDGNVDTEYYYGQAGRMEYPSRVSRTSDQGFIVVGALGVPSGNDIQHDAYLVKLNSTGQLVWESSFGGTQFDQGRSTIETPDGGFLLLGWTRSYGAGQRDFYLVKTDAQGNEQWRETYGTNREEIGASIIRLHDGNYLLTGSGSNPSGNGSVGRLYKISSNGDELWSEIYAYTGNTSHDFHKTVELPNGELVSAGATGAGGSAGWLVKTTSEGEVIWQREYDKNENTDLFYSLLATDDGGFLLSGQAINEATNSQDAWLLKVDSVGCPYPNCTVGIDEQERTVMVNVWPNPCTDVLNIEKTLSSATLDITVFDINGKEILKQVQNDGRGTIDVSGWVEGIYILQGIDEKGRNFSVKVVKQQ